MQKTSLWKMLALNTYWVGLSFMWNVLHPIVLPAVMLNFVPDEKKNTYLGVLTFVGLVIAMVVQPVSGALSDGWISRFGRRRPLIVLGTLFDFIFLALLAWAGGLTWLFIGYIGLQFSSNIAHGPAQGLLPDSVPEEQIGAASGLKIFMDMLTMAVATLGRLTGLLRWLQETVQVASGEGRARGMARVVGERVQVLGIRYWRLAAAARRMVTAVRSRAMSARGSRRMVVEEDDRTGEG